MEKQKVSISQNFVGRLLLYICLHLLVSTSGAQYSGSRLSLFNRTCTSREECSFSLAYLNCIYARCICSDHEFYDKEYEICRIKVPSQCMIRRSPENVQPCIRDAYCAFPLDYKRNELKSSIQGSCQCTDGAPPKPNGLCTSGVSNPLHVNRSYYFLIISFSLSIGGDWISWS